MHSIVMRVAHCLVVIAASAVSICDVGAAAQASGARPKYIPKPTDFAVVCTLFNGPARGGNVHLPDLPITYDAHVVIGARVERLEFGTSPWPVGTNVNFVIHSPTILFGSRFSGEQFVLTFSRFRPTSREDQIWFAPETRYLLQAIERVSPPKGGA